MKIFLSHASEDKQGLVLPLAVALQRYGVSVWYDSFVIQPGDSIVRSVFSGIDQSSVAAIIITPTFAKKNWTCAELDALLSKAIEAKLIVIPVLVGVDVSELARLSSYLSTKLAIVHENIEKTAAALAVATFKNIPSEISIGSSVVPTRWHCIHCGNTIWGAERTCPSCNKSLMIKSEGKVSLFEILKKQYGLFGSIIITLSIIIVFYFISDQTNWIIGLIFILAAMFIFYRQYRDK